MKVTTQGRVFFYLLLVFVFFITYMLLKPYLNVVVFSVVVVVITKPLYDYILRLVKGHKGMATTLTIITLGLAVAIPLIFVINVTVNQATILAKDISTLVAGKNANLTSIIEEINKILATIPYVQYRVSEESILEALRKMVGPVSSFVADRAISLGGASVEWITNAIIFLSIVSTLLPTYEKVLQLLRDLSPLPDELDQIYISRFVAMTKAMFKGIFVIALIQGIVVGGFMWFTGTAYVFFLTLLAIFVSVLPLGVNILAIPVGIAHWLLGNTWQGIVIIAGSLLVVSQLDNLIRPKLVSADAYLNPVLVLLSAFGGLAWFGFFGVIYGPIIAIFFVTTIEIYLKYYRLAALEPAVKPVVPPAELEADKGASRELIDSSPFEK